jgi:outer membrane murein-binding lipoprotein Lpp
MQIDIDMAGAGASVKAYVMAHVKWFIVAACVLGILVVANVATHQVESRYGFLSTQPQDTVSSRIDHLEQSNRELIAAVKHLVDVQAAAVEKHDAKADAAKPAPKRK